jgi:hypothetical protein
LYLGPDQLIPNLDPQAKNVHIGQQPDEAHARHGDNTVMWIGSGLPTIHPGRSNFVKGTSQTIGISLKSLVGIIRRLVEQPAVTPGQIQLAFGSRHRDQLMQQ